MNPRDPNTWADLATHPFFDGGKFNPNWYEGDAVADIARLKSAAQQMLESFPDCSCELVVLDDCTTFVNLEKDGAIIAAVYPVLMDNREPCYFVDVEGCGAEFRVATPNDVVDVVRQHHRERS